MEKEEQKDTIGVKNMMFIQMEDVLKYERKN